jgi:hypothetical protein
MYVDLILWDDENEPHVVGPGEVSVEEVEEVIRGHPGGHDEPDDFSLSTGLPLVFGNTTSGKHIVVVYEDLSDNDLIVVRPKAAYPVKEYGG